jgi:environmental stress-induced protein Ves
MITLIPATSFKEVPWKNGRGITHDVLVEPAGAGYDASLLRVSIAPITAEGPFSTLPGIERTITLLEPNPLVLLFEDGQEITLEPFTPVTFDSVLAPMSRLPAGPTRVINVMAARRALSAKVGVLTGPEAQEVPLVRGERALLYAAQGDWTVSAGGERETIPSGAACLVDGASHLRLSGPSEGRLLVARLREQPAQSD